MCLILLSVVILTMAFFTFVVQAAPNVTKTINFQGRLLSSSGAVVPDGYYNMQFKIYEGGSGTQTGNPDGSLKWTEAHINNGGTNGVRVRNGIFSVNLGSVASFGTSVNWDHDTLWLSMNVAGTASACSEFSTAPCTADGEMLPMKRINATPYAINSGQLNGKTADDFFQKTESVQEGSLKISGLLQSNTSILAPSLDTSTATELTIGAVNATSIAIGNNESTTIVNGGLAATNIDSLPVDPPEPQADTPLLTDDFSTADSNKWDYYSQHTTVTQGQLRITPNTNYEGIFSIDEYDMTSAVATVQLAQVPNIGNGPTSATFEVQNLDSNSFYITWEDGLLYFGEDVAGNHNVISTAYNATDHAWIRIRESSGTIYWETSPDSINWTVRHSKAPAIGSLESMIIGLYAGRWAAEPSPGTARFDNFSFIQIAAPPTQNNSILSIGSSNANEINIGNSQATTNIQGNINASGTISIQSSGDSAETFNVQRSDDEQLFNIDATNRQVTIGQADNNGTLLVLDTKTTSGDPAGTNGAMYYNSSAGKFRCYESGGWKDCVTPLPVSKVVQTATTSSSTTPKDVNDLAFPLAANTKYRYVFTLKYRGLGSNSATGFGITAPAGSTNSNWCVSSMSVTSSPGVKEWGSYCGTSDASSTHVVGGAGDTASDYTSNMEGYIQTGENGGDLKLRMVSGSTQTVEVSTGSFGILQIVQ